MAGIEWKEILRGVVLLVALILTVNGVAMATQKWEGADEGAGLFFLMAILSLLWAQAI